MSNRRSGAMPFTFRCKCWRGTKVRLPLEFRVSPSNQDSAQFWVCWRLSKTIPVLTCCVLWPTSLPRLVQNLFCSVADAFRITAEDIHAEGRWRVSLHWKGVGPYQETCRGGEVAPCSSKLSLRSLRYSSVLCLCNVITEILTSVVAELSEQFAHAGGIVSVSSLLSSEDPEVIRIASGVIYNLIVTVNKGMALVLKANGSSK